MKANVMKTAVLLVLMRLSAEIDALTAKFAAKELVKLLKPNVRIPTEKIKIKLEVWLSQMKTANLSQQSLTNVSDTASSRKGFVIL